MNKNAVYLAVFGVLCVLAGVVVGAGIVKKVNLPFFNPERPNFTKRAERVMWHRSKDLRAKKERGKDRLFTMLNIKLELDQDQQVKVKEIIEQNRQEISQVGEDVRNAINNIKKKGDQQIMDVLNPQQQEKFRALLEKFEDKGKRRHSKGNYGSMMGHRPHSRKIRKGKLK